MSAPLAAKTERAALEIPSLDGIRALSFLLVFLAHIGVASPGDFGVSVFFFLSGYLITTLMRCEAERTGSVSLKLFYLRRALRILPPFYLVLGLAMALALAGVLPQRFSWSGLVAQALHYSNYWVIQNGWHGLISGTGVYWSLAVEEHFYLLFPALYLLLLRARATSRQQHTLLFGLCALVLAWRCYIVFGAGIIGDITYIASDTRFDSMLFGCALAVWGNPALDFKPSLKPSLLEIAAALAGLGLLWTSLAVRDPAFRETFRYSIQGLGLYSLFHFVVRYPRSLAGRILNLRPLRFIGRLSYSLYLLHQVVIFALFKHIPAPRSVRAVVAFVVSLLLATLIWRFVEQPCASLRRRFSSSATS